MKRGERMESGFWVFGYGSLMWDPGFAFAERCPAVLEGFARSFCMWSVHHRGTPEAPGLVLALDAEEGAVCHGLAYYVEAHEAAAALAYLRERELVSAAYLETTVPLRLEDGRRVSSVAYVVDRDHAQYTGPLPFETQAEVIARAHGGRGPNSEYLWNTARHLAELGMEDLDLSQLAEMVRHRLSP